MFNEDMFLSLSCSSTTTHPSVSTSGSGTFDLVSLLNVEIRERILVIFCCLVLQSFDNKESGPQCSVSTKPTGKILWIKTSIIYSISFLQKKRKMNENNNSFKFFVIQIHLPSQKYPKKNYLRPFP